MFGDDTSNVIMNVPLPVPRPGRIHPVSLLALDGDAFPLNNNVSLLRGQKAVDQLCQGFDTILRATGQPHPTSVSVALDAFRHISANANPVASTAVRGYFAYSKTDLDTFGLPIGWDYLINKDEVGRSLVFPVLLKPSVQWSTRNFKLGDAGTLVQLAQTPYERINIRCCTDAYFLHWQFHDWNFFGVTTASVRTLYQCSRNTLPMFRSI